MTVGVMERFKWTKDPSGGAGEHDHAYTCSHGDAIWTVFKNKDGSEVPEEVWDGTTIWTDAMTDCPDAGDLVVELEAQEVSGVADASQAREQDARDTGFRLAPDLGVDGDRGLCVSRRAEVPTPRGVRHLRVVARVLRVCILGSQGDITASASCADNAAIYREMVDLEVTSTFSFQEKWLADAAPHLLSEDVRAALVEAKARGKRRMEAETRIPDHLLYTKGWPTAMPTLAEAELLCEVRKEVADALGIEVQYTDPVAVRS